MSFFNGLLNLGNLGRRGGYERLPDTPPSPSFTTSGRPGVNFPGSVGDTLAKITRAADTARLEVLKGSLHEAAQRRGGGTLSDAINQFHALDLPMGELSQLAALPVRTPSQERRFADLKEIVRVMVGSGADLSCRPSGGHSPMVQSAMMFPVLPEMSRGILNFVEAERNKAMAAASLQRASNVTAPASPIKTPFFVAKGEITFLHALAIRYPDKADPAAYNYLKLALRNGAPAHQPYLGLTRLKYATVFGKTQFVTDFNRAVEELRAEAGAAR